MNRLRILTYHEVQNRNNFQQQLEYLLKSKWTPVSPKDLELWYISGKTLPKKPVLISFDDADPSVFYNGLPVLKELRIPFIVFVISSLIGSDQPYWWDEAEYLELNVGDLKLMANDERIDCIKQSRINKPPLKSNQLTFEQLKEIENYGGVVANHTHTHPLLDKCNNEIVSDEIIECSRVLKEYGFSGFKYFAYPNGNFTDVAEKVLEANGFKLAFLFDHKLTDIEGDPLRLSRLSVNSYTSISKFRLIISGFHSQILPIRRIFQ